MAPHPVILIPHKAAPASLTQHTGIGLFLLLQWAVAPEPGLEESLPKYRLSATSQGNVNWSPGGCFPACCKLVLVANCLGVILP